MQSAEGTITAIDRDRVVLISASIRQGLARGGKNNIRLSPHMATAVSNSSRSGFGIRRGKPLLLRSLRLGPFAILEKPSSSLPF